MSMPITSTPEPGAPMQAPPPIAAVQPFRKSYHSAKNEKINTPFEIDIDGTVFVARPGRVPGTVQIDFSGLTVTRDPDAMWNYFRCAFVDERGYPRTEDFDAFQTFLNDPVREIDINILTDIIKDMIEFANGLPTGQSSS